MTTSKIRRSNRINCSMMSRRRLRFGDFSKNSIAAQRTRRKRMRLIRWMMMGELTRAPPIAMLRGLANSSNMGTASAGGSQGHAVVEELGEDGVEGIAGADQGVVDPLAGTTAADLDHEFLECLQVAVAEGAGVAEHVGQLLHSLEPRGAGEREVQLVVVHDVEDQHVVLAVGQHFQAAEQRLAVDQQV